MYFQISNPISVVQNMIRKAGFPSFIEEEILDRYSQFGRGYHNLYHIAFLWHSYENFSYNLKDMKNDTRFLHAILAHDIIYDPQSKINEEESVEWWIRKKSTITKSILTENDEKWIIEAILATRNHFLPYSMETIEYGEQQLYFFLGLDLLSLAAPYHIFKQNQELIRAEYSHLSNIEWYNGRKNFLLNVQKYPYIFKDGYLRNQFEHIAQFNISKSLKEMEI